MLVAAGATLVGIDSLNIDDIGDRSRPVHSILLGAGIPIVEHLCGLGQLPAEGFRFSAVPPKVAGFGTWPVRAYATTARSSTASPSPVACPSARSRVSGLPAIALRTDELEVVAVPAAGMKLTNLRRPRGREWLWRNDQIPLAPPRDAALLRGDRGQRRVGRVLPHGRRPRRFPARRRARPQLPDHGELWARRGPAPPTSTPAASPSRPPPPDASCRTSSTASSPSISHEPVMRLRYRLRNTGELAVPLDLVRPPAAQRSAGQHAGAAVAAPGEGRRGARTPGAEPRRHRELAGGVRRRDGRFTFPARCLGGEAVR